MLACSRFFSFCVISFITITTSGCGLLLDESYFEQLPEFVSHFEFPLGYGADGTFWSDYGSYGILIARSGITGERLHRDCFDPEHGEGGCAPDFHTGSEEFYGTINEEGLLVGQGRYLICPGDDLSEINLLGDLGGPETWNQDYPQTVYREALSPVFEFDEETQELLCDWYVFADTIFTLPPLTLAPFLNP